MGTMVSRWWHRLTSDEDDEGWGDPSVDAGTAPTLPVSRCGVGEKVEIRGRLRTVSLQPSDHLPALIAEMYDGTAAIDLVWLGRRSINGIEAGRRLNVAGRVAMREGRKTIYNPVYSLLPEAQ